MCAVLLWHASSAHSRSVSAVLQRSRSTLRSNTPGGCCFQMGKKKPAETDAVSADPRRDADAAAEPHSRNGAVSAVASVTTGLQSSSPSLSCNVPHQHPASWMLCSAPGSTQSAGFLERFSIVKSGPP